MNKSHMFAAQQVADLAKRIDAATTTSVIGVPGAGISLFLKHLSKQPLGHMVYMDVFSLSTFKPAEFFALLLDKLGGKVLVKPTEAELVASCKKQLEILAQQHKKVVVCIAGFDQLQPEFSVQFFHYLRSLRAVEPSRVSFIFGICRRLDTLLPADLINADLTLFSSVYYLPPYASQDTRYLLATYGPQTDLPSTEVERLIELSGGHFQFLQLLLGSERRSNPIQDPFIQLAFNNIFMPLSTPQKAMVRKVATGNSLVTTDDYLLQVGIVKKVGGKLELFSPLFADCVRAFSAPKLPVKERRLLAILKKNHGKVVSKRELYDAVWLGKDIGSEWALNALVYRLRKHPAFTAQNCTIENHKKLGYVLTRNI